jgi:hypothetical protein
VATVIILGVLLVVGFLVMVGTIIYRMANPKPPQMATGKVTAGPVLDLPMPAGARVRAMTLNEGKLAIHLDTGKRGEEIVVIDVRKGRELSRIRINSGQVPTPAQ